MAVLPEKSTMSFIDSLIKWGKTQHHTNLYMNAVKGMTTAHSKEEFESFKATAKKEFKFLVELCGDNKEKLREINDRSWKIIEG